MTVLRISHPPRRIDDWGNGAFASTRGGRYHLGRDYLYEPGEEVRTPMEATVLRLGYPYNDSESVSRYRLIEMLSFNVETGAKLIWGGEAAAVRPDGRANPHQTLATRENRAGLAALPGDCELVAVIDSTSAPKTLHVKKIIPKKQ